MLMGVVGFLVVMESLAAHFLLHPRYPVTGFVVTATGLLTLVWLVWDYAALGAATTRVTSEDIVLSAGLRATAVIPLRLVSSAITPSWSDLSGAPVVDPTKPAEPNVLLSLSEPVTVKVLGGRRKTRRLALCVDAPAEFLIAVKNADDAS
jgi:hypothetical protein